MNDVFSQTARAGEPAPRTARIPLLHPEEMSQEQRAIYDSVMAGPRGRMIGPLLAAMHSPELAMLWSRFGEYLRFRTCMPKALNELAILVCGRCWTSQVEWWVHSRVAEDTGLPAAVIDAIREGKEPVFASDAQLEVYEFARHLQQTGQVPADLHRAIVTRWGVQGVVELTAVIGYYTLVAMTLNAHEIPVPTGIDEPLPRRDALFMLPPGRLAA